ncbi:hypothetical protein QBC43DRAFT_331134 [Cladorrhinum sp. PSN259]|nr:hypothetical protein QBC43DRAFT_331134 [Cladorrhinum sp. PSN259]
MRSTLTLIALGLSSLVAAAPAPAANATELDGEVSIMSGGFFNSGCSENNLWYTTINSKCNGVWTSLDLNPYIINANGQLKWGGGGFGASCGSGAGGTCNLQWSVLGCDCKKTNGQVVWTTVELNQHLAYSNGRLYVN